jgi:PKD repeat protein
VSEYCKTVIVQQVMPCNIHASFSFVGDSVQTNKVYFTNLSVGSTPNTITRWSFGDGAISYDSNPIHIYQTSGAYTVCLLVRRDSLCSDDTCAIVQVQVPNTCNLVVNFSNTIDSAHPNIVHFTNLTTPISTTDSVTWNFGDGSSSHDYNVTHTYTQEGTYSVCLAVRRNTTDSLPCARYSCRSIIVGTTCNLVAGFTFRADSAAATPIPPYIFVNTSTPLTTIDSSFWNFGDGTPVVINPANPIVHAYTSPGVYVVCLKVKKVQPGTINIICERQTCQTILIDTPHVQCNLQVYFAYRADSINHSKIYFTNYSTPLASTDSIRWTFGDGSSSADVNAVHTYNAPGTYTACLRVKKIQAAGTAPCVSEYCKIIIIQQVIPCYVHADFFFVRDSIQTNKVYFNNYSTGSDPNTLSRWNFGDGTYSYDSNPTHIYQASGAYTVCLIVGRDSLCTDDTCEIVQVQVPNTCNLVVNFSTAIDSLHSNIFHFTNLSTPLSTTDSVTWNFGDGATSHDFLHATHTYTQGGVFNVCLVVKKNNSTGNPACVREFCQSIIVDTPHVQCNLQAYFAYLADSINHSKIYFTNYSTPLASTDSIRWTFGDGSNSADINPVHTYNVPGTYTVCLRVKKIQTAGTVPCVSEYCKIVIITPSTIDSCYTQVSFVTRLDSTNNRKVRFTNITVNPIPPSRAEWNFGDGTSGTEWNEVVHEYAIPGWYLVCLTIINSNNCSKTYCDSVFVPGNVIPPVNCDTFHLEYGYRRDEYMPNKLYFFATGNAPVYYQQWTFTNLGNNDSAITLNQNNPVYVFPDTGVYRVCVRGAFSTACVKEFCDEVRIYSTIAPAQCVLVSYPNPAQNVVSFNVQLDQTGIITSTVINMQGVVLMQYTQTGLTGNNFVTLNIQNLPPGFYTVRVMYNGHVCYTRFQKI